MGMDVYGEDPITIGEPPTRPKTEDYNSDEWSVYWEKQNEYQSKNKGVYFRNNIWSVSYTHLTLPTKRIV